MVIINLMYQLKMNNNLEVSLVKELCPVCGKEMDGPIIMNSILTEDCAKEVKDLHNKVIGFTDHCCKECAEYKDIAVFFVSIDESKSSKGSLKDLYRTGKIVGIKKDSDIVKQYNKEHLPTGSFFVAIDYGYGTGTWNSTSGGTAHIVTATGNTVYYNISADGSVTKLLESPDLYWEYTQMGGTKTPTQFAIALTDLIGK